MSAQVHALKAINTRVEAPEDGAALFGRADKWRIDGHGRDR